MTKLLHPVRRESQIQYQHRPIVIQIEPPGLIALKEKGRHQWFRLPLGVAYQLAVRAYVTEQARLKRHARAARKTIHAV